MTSATDHHVTDLKKSIGSAVALGVAAIWLVAPLAVSASTVVILPSYSVSQYYFTQVQGATFTPSTSTVLGSVSSAQASPAGTSGAGKAQLSGSVTGTPSPLVTGSVHAALDGSTVTDHTLDTFTTAVATYQGELKYYFEVLGPTGQAPVTISSVSAFNLQGTGTGDAFDAQAYLHIGELDAFGNDTYTVLNDQSNVLGANSALQFETSDVTGTLATGYVGGFHEKGTYSLFTNTVYLADLTVVVTGHIDGRGGSIDASASLDPTFAIAAGTANAGAYSLYVSNGIGNAAAPPTAGVPEPATWATMLCGVFGVGVAARRRVRRSATPKALNA